MSLTGKELMQAVKANHAKLDACPGHDFVQTPDSRPLRSRFACSRCGGTVDGVAWLWYQRGVEHGKAQAAAGAAAGAQA